MLRDDAVWGPVHDAFCDLVWLAQVTAVNSALEKVCGRVHILLLFILSCSCIVSMRGLEVHIFNIVMTITGIGAAYAGHRDPERAIGQADAGNDEGIDDVRNAEESVCCLWQEMNAESSPRF